MNLQTLLGVELHKDTPDRLNTALLDGDLDIGPISLVEYLRRPAELLGGFEIARVAARQRGPAEFQLL